MSTYKDYSFTSDKPSHTSSYLIKGILSMLDKEKNKIILDVGCGNGWLSRLLIDHGYNVYGIDASVSGISIAKKYYPNNYFLFDVISNQLPLEISNVKFDTIISTEVIEHLYSPLEYIQFCKNILHKTCGELIISTPYHGYLKNLILAILGKMDKHYTATWEGGHIKFFSKRTLTKLVTEQGFKFNKFIGCGRLPFLWKSMIIQFEINETN